ncbi:hypothetical protein FHR87_000117 [Azomonas macrocytogenes]|uniref:DUF2892 domain-containing protein n=1 Tax=Azomonas macrocytogenes TaxID=69962 RepID=A0A839SWI6_AZOMA|nr:hypothetical protein [Azomonas macrocytogenes]
MKNPLSNNATEHNVHGWERTASLAGGLLFIGKGLRRGGLGGLLELALGGAALTRGLTGHCRAKQALNELRGRRNQTLEPEYLGVGSMDAEHGLGLQQNPARSSIDTGIGANTKGRIRNPETHAESGIITDPLSALETLPGTTPVTNPVRQDVNPGRNSGNGRTNS